MMENQLRLLKFEASWCAPCKALSGILEEILPDYPDVDLTSIDVDAVPVMAQQYGIRSVPTLVLLDHEGFEVARTVGMLPRAKIAQMLSL
jgi:thioredoxin-like negative regulator of GroEL